MNLVFYEYNHTQASNGSQLVLAVINECLNQFESSILSCVHSYYSNVFWFQSLENTETSNIAIGIQYSRVTFWDRGWTMCCAAI